MLKRMSIKRIITSLIALLLVTLIYLIPTNHTTKTTQIIETTKYINDTPTHTIYLLDKNNYISMTKVPVINIDKKELAKELITYLIKDNKYQDKIPNNFTSLINSNTKIISVEVIDNIIKCNLSKEFLDTKIPESTLEALVYTLTSIEGINTVMLNIENDTLTEINNKKIPIKLTREIGINKDYNINSTKDINQTTIYYNNDDYYTPITKYTNEQEEKINIIIKELTSTTINDNLKSKMNSNTKLKNYEIKDNTLLLTFNEEILENQKIPEEVINTISLSVIDNYNIENIVMLVNQEEITKINLKSLEY